MRLPITLNGMVTRFAGNGRKLGYPTANLNVQTDLEEGVYFGRADLGELQDKPALIFIGVPVTMGDKTHRVEAHLLDIADQDYYDQKIEIEVQKFHRPNQKFDSVDELLQAMSADEQAARAWFNLI